jgi:transposase, IS5 family
MKMNLMEPLRLKFEKVNWAQNPAFGMLDTILELHPELIVIVKSDILKGCKQSDFGRQDMPSVEQIFRAAIFKEMKGLDYRELEHAQTDSRICEQFVKIDNLRPFSFQVFQKYISKITEENLQLLLVAINKIAINEGLEDIEKLRQDSTVISTNIHYPTNNSLVWDCIKESHRLLSHLAKESNELSFRDYTVSSKKAFFKINNTKSGDKRVELFKKQLVTFTKCINQVSNVIKKKPAYSVKALALQTELGHFLPIMQRVFSMTERKEIKGELVPNEEKLFSIYEQHTDIIAKGGREVQFGHKINLSTGQSNLILSCDVLKGNPSDSNLYQPTMDKVISTYGITPRDSAADGGYTSKANSDYAVGKGIKNIVFNKIVGSLKNIVSSANMETRLKKWRSGIEANISNFKRGFNIHCCAWKGEAHFKAKVLWSAIAYNIRVMTAAMLCEV